MVLIVGGEGSGKRSFAQTLGFAPEQMADGVLDALSQGMGEEILPELIGQMDYGNPGEIANQLLTYCIKQSKGQIRDDMTVLVMGIWETEQAAG